MWQIPDAVDTGVCAPDDGRKYHPKHVEQFPDINKLCNVASCWIYEYIGILSGAHTILHISRIRVNGPISLKSLQAAKYYVCFNDDYSKYCRVFFIKQNNYVSKCLRTFQNKLSTAGHTVKMFLYDDSISVYILYMNYRCYQTVLRVKHFYRNRESCEVLTGYLSFGRRPGGDWANTWHWTENFRSFFSKRKLYQRQLLLNFIAYRISRGSFDYKYIVHAEHFLCN